MFRNWCQIFLYPRFIWNINEFFTVISKINAQLKLINFELSVYYILFAHFNELFRDTCARSIISTGRYGTRTKCRPSFRRRSKTAASPTVIEPLIAKVAVEYHVLRAPFGYLLRSIGVAPRFYFLRGRERQGTRKWARERGERKRGCFARAAIRPSSLLPPQIDLILATCCGCSIISFES